MPSSDSAGSPESGPSVGTIIKKGQPIFKIKPDEKIVLETEAEIAARKQKATDIFLAGI